MMHSREIAGASYTWREPPTALDVLEWEVRVQSYQGHPRAFVQRAASWAAQFVVDETEASLCALGLNEAEGLQALILVCTCVAQSAHLPTDYLEGLRLLWARDADVADVKPLPWCKCPRCSGKNPDAPMSACKFDGIAPSVITSTGQLMGVDEAGLILSQPFWVLQIQAERVRIRGRKASADEKQKDVNENGGGWDAHYPQHRNTKRRSTKRS